MYNLSKRKMSYLTFSYFKKLLFVLFTLLFISSNIKTSVNKLLSYHPLAGFILNEGQDKLAYLKSTGKIVWTYECMENAKHLSPLGYYRSQAWLSWHRGLIGMGFWSYNISSADLWPVPEGTLDYLLTYQSKGIVSSKQWEAIREGIEDYRILYELKNVANLSKDHSNLQLLEEIDTLLKDDAFEIARYCSLDEYRTESGLGWMKEISRFDK